MFATVQSDGEERWAQGLNPEQLEAVTHDGAPMLVVAGAGTGKTRTLAARVARILGEGADPDRMLLLTFSRRAAREMLRRAETMGADRSAGRVWGGTFHAMANRVLREHGHAVGLSPGFTILDQGDAVDLMGVARGQVGAAEKGRRFPKKETLLDIWSRVANAQQTLTDALTEHFPWCQADVDDVRAVFAEYAQRKADRGLLDFDDLLLYWRALVQPGSVAAAHLAARFDHVLVDEYQDTNLLQADIVGGLRPTGQGLFVVGDDAQAIYGFRAASAANMAQFAERFPDARVVTLSRNYRSFQPILDVANAVMAGARGVYVKELRATRERDGAATALRPTLAQAGDEAAEAIYVCERVLAHREEGVALHDQCVLFRTGHHSARLEIELARRNIPFVKFGGLKFLESAHVKDVLAFLRVLDNPSDELAWHRILGLLQGVGPATTRAILDHLSVTSPGALGRMLDDPPAVPARAQADLALLCDALRACVDAAASATSPAVELQAIRTIGRSLFERRYPDAAARLVDLEQLEVLAGGCKDRSTFLSELVIDPPAKTSDLAGPPLLDDDWLVLSTIHSAKGGEWDVVYVVHAADGNIPSDMATGTPDGVEEERRLLYVALTRARDHLYVSYPLRYYRRRFGLDDDHVYAQPSRFLAPATNLFDQPPVEMAECLAAVVAAPAGPDPVAPALAALWR